MNDNAIPAVDDGYNTTVQEYVEIIRDLVQVHRVARIKDIADIRGVTRSSVSTAMNMLRELGLVDHEHYGYVDLTEEGTVLGEILSSRHSIIQKFLHRFLRLDSDLADKEACKLEHAMGAETLNALVKFVHETEQLLKTSVPGHESDS
ncbi:metal-dependent transcriptional regulator [bacterium]|nr:metal-dependent transcriptional regulator [bacterium]